MGSILTYSLYTAHNWENAEIVKPVLLGTTALTFFTTILFNDLWKYNMRKAVTNYNLYIQGIPIPIN
jgi:hypothetical protein